ncbi:MAG: hypothetical protein IJH12_00890 [Clostridia bacterium]|nr:hypothetical protein [Clostridia bacterium]
MKKDEYVEQMKNIKAPEELIKKTISNINQMEQYKKLNKSNYLKKLLLELQQQ